MLLYLVIIGQNKTKPNQTLSIWFFFLNSYFKVTYWQKNKIPQSQSISRTGTLLLTSEPGVSSWCCWNGSSIGKKHYLQAEVPFPGGSMATAPAARQVGFRSPKMAFSFQKSSSSLHDPNGVHRTLSDLLQGNKKIFWPRQELWHCTIAYSTLNQSCNCPAMDVHKLHKVRIKH